MLTCRSKVGSRCTANCDGTNVKFPRRPRSTRRFSASRTRLPSFLAPKKWNVTSAPALHRLMSPSYWYTLSHTHTHTHMHSAVYSLIYDVMCGSFVHVCWPTDIGREYIGWQTLPIIPYTRMDNEHSTKWMVKSCWLQLYVENGNVHIHIFHKTRIALAKNEANDLDLSSYILFLWIGYIKWWNFNRKIEWYRILYQKVDSLTAVCIYLDIHASMFSL